MRCDLAYRLGFVFHLLPEYQTRTGEVGKTERGRSVRARQRLFRLSLLFSSHTLTVFITLTAFAAATATATYAVQFTCRVILAIEALFKIVLSSA